MAKFFVQVLYFNYVFLRLFFIYLHETLQKKFKILDLTNKSSPQYPIYCCKYVELKLKARLFIWTSEDHKFPQN